MHLNCKSWTFKNETEYWQLSRLRENIQTHSNFYLWIIFFHYARSLALKNDVWSIQSNTASTKPQTWEGECKYGMFPKSFNMKRDDEAETEIRIDFEPTFKCEITGSENKT